jgi:hypothetical protein
MPSARARRILSADDADFYYTKLSRAEHADPLRHMCSAA